MSHFRSPRLAATLVAVALLLLLGSCVTLPDGTVRLTEIVRATGGDPPWVRDDGTPGVRVRRGASEQPARINQVLERGDIVVTGPGVAAVLRITASGEVAVDENSAVRIGSLEVLFGRLFADLRGLFSVRSETVEAVNEGTRYLFEVGRDRNVRIVVSEGALSCRSPQGAWPAVRLPAGRSLVSLYPGRTVPRVFPGDAREVDGPLRAITAAPRSGWCCSGPGGRVYPGVESRCPGDFALARETAEARCRPAAPPPPPPTGWCCVTSQRRLIELPPARCEALKGTYYTNETVARQRCVFVN